MIQLDPKSINPDTSPRIEFTPPFPEAETVDAAELWDTGWIEELLDWTEILDEADALSGMYCNISSLIVQICLQHPDLCPTEDPEGDC